MKPLHTARLVLRLPALDDADFILRLVNDPAWLQHIGDRGVRTLEDSRAYLENGLLTMYRRYGFSLNLVTLREDHTPIGLCGLLKRDALEDVDLGFAFLPEFRSRGYATESALAMMAHAKHALLLTRLAAITSPGNDASTRLLHRLGFRFEGLRRLTADAPEVEFHLVDL